MPNRGVGWLWGMIVAALLASVAPASADGAAFPLPRSLRPQVEFWKRVYAVYGEHQIVIHDTEDLTRVYSVVDFRDRAASGEDPLVLEVLEKAAVAAERQRIRTVLLALDARDGNAGGLDAEERKIWNLFAEDKNPRKFRAATEDGRIRAQRGLRERFEQGLRISRRYLGAMEAIFRAEGLPLELTRLPFVESCFDIEAYSKVGAAGIWQFMPATGRSYLRIDGVVDERRDPLRATRGAAQHLARDYASLGTWPLAITAYNHGRGGMRRAVRETGTTDIGVIVATYRGPLFGFASRNFYAEFLAALDVERDHERHFGKVVFDAPVDGADVPLPSGIRAERAATLAACSTDELAELNPAVDAVIFRRNGVIPRGYVLRVPAGAASSFTTELASLPAEPEPRRSVTRSQGAAKADRPATVARTHRVAKGQTLTHIARRYRVSVDGLRRANSLRGNTVRAGQVLKIPAG